MRPVPRPAAPEPWMITVQVTYTKGKDRGCSLQLPIYPCEGDAWRKGIEA